MNVAHTFPKLPHLPWMLLPFAPIVWVVYLMIYMIMGTIWVLYALGWVHAKGIGLTVQAVRHVQDVHGELVDAEPAAPALTADERAFLRSLGVTR
jgi:hypothetical protein